MADVSIFINLANNKQMMLFHYILEQGRMSPRQYDMLIEMINEAIEKALREFSHKYVEERMNET